MALLITFLIGITGPVIALSLVKYLGRIISTRKHKVLTLLMGSLTFAHFIMFGLLDFSLNSGPELDFSLFQISYGISETILILLVLVLPVAFGLSLGLSLKKAVIWKRVLVPLLFTSFVIGINFFLTFLELRQHQWDHETNYSCHYSERWKGTVCPLSQ